MRSTTTDSSETTEEIIGRSLTVRDMVARQLDLIQKTRSDVANPLRVAIWAEALEALRDLVFPYAEADPDPGVPGVVDEKGVQCVGRFNQEWERRPLGGFVEDGEWFPDPSAADCRHAERLIMALLDRHRLLVKTRKTSGPKKPEQGPGATRTPEPEHQDPETLLGAL